MTCAEGAPPPLRACGKAGRGAQSERVSLYPQSVKKSFCQDFLFALWNEVNGHDSLRFTIRLYLQ